MNLDHMFSQILCFEPYRYNIKNLLHVKLKSNILYFIEKQFTVKNIHLFKTYNIYWNVFRCDNMAALIKLHAHTLSVVPCGRESWSLILSNRTSRPRG
jgi:hypothetical protein